MANSSDWIAALVEGGRGVTVPHAGPAAAPVPAWMARAGESSGFVEGAPFAPARPGVPPRSQPAIGAATPPADSPPAAPLAPDPLAEAYARGEAAGRAAQQQRAQQETAQQQARLQALRLNFRQLDQAAMDALASDLADTVIALCGEAVAGFATDPEHLHARCDAAARRLGSAAASGALHLHPSDITALDDRMREEWRIVPDETLERGALRFEGAAGAISDGPADWRRAIRAALQG